MMHCNQRIDSMGNERFQKRSAVRFLEGLRFSEGQGVRTRFSNQSLAVPTVRTARPALSILLIAGSITFAGGCRMFGIAPPIGEPGRLAATDLDDPTANRVIQASAEESIVESTKQTGKQVLNFVSGREQENVQRAIELYQEGEGLYRQAASMPRDEAKSIFRKAARRFQRAAEAAPGTAYEQDALFMQGESLFFADQIVEATDVYGELQKRFPRNRHIDRVAARLFSISRYWIETEKAENSSWLPINLTDPTRPRLDIDGHAVRILDQIRYDDPTGRLADDATMAAAAEYIRQQKFEEADEFLTDLRETFGDSEHLFLAHLLGIRCKLETYAGPAYSGLVLEEAEKLVQQTRQRFPDKLADKKYADMVARAAAEIAFRQAERLEYRADYREKRKEFGAARFNYRELLENYADTPQAEIARERMAKIEDYPAVPEQRLSWLTTIFTERDQHEPLKRKQPGSESSESMLR